MSADHGAAVWLLRAVSPETSAFFPPRFALPDARRPAFQRGSSSSHVAKSLAREVLPATSPGRDALSPEVLAGARPIGRRGKASSNGEEVRLVASPTHRPIERLACGPAAHGPTRRRCANLRLCFARALATILCHKSFRGPRALFFERRGTLRKDFPEPQARMSDEPLIAVFVDFENLAIGVRDMGVGTFQIQLVLKRLLEKGTHRLQARLLRLDPLQGRVRRTFTARGSS